MKKINNEIVFNITQTAKQIGVHIQTLMNWRNYDGKMLKNKIILLPIKNEQGQYSNYYRQKDIENYLALKLQSTQYFSAVETAPKINKSVGTLSRWVNNTQKYNNQPILLPVDRKGKKPLYREEDIQKYLQEVEKVKKNKTNNSKAVKLLSEIKSAIKNLFETLEKEGY